MCNTEAYDAYECITISLRELLVPMATTWAIQFNRLESNPLVDYAVARELLTELKEMYTVPYPYKNGYWMEYLTRKYGTCDPNKMSAADEKAIKTGVQERLDLALTTAISDSMIAEVDSNYDIGCIAYRRTGIIVPFDYSKVTGISFMATPAVLNLRLEMQKYKPGSKRYNEILCQLSEAEDYADLKYSFDYNNTEGDKYYKPGRTFDAFPGHYARIMNVDPTIEYMQTAFSEHSKCIILA